MKLIEELARKPKQRAAAPTAHEGEQAAGPATGMGFAQTSSRPNVFGGMDEYRDGKLVSSSRPNVFGGFDKTRFSLHGDGEGDEVGSALADILGFPAPGDDER